VQNTGYRWIYQDKQGKSPMSQEDIFPQAHQTGSSFRENSKRYGLAVILLLFVVLSWFAGTLYTAFD